MCLSRQIINSIHNTWYPSKTKTSQENWPFDQRIVSNTHHKLPQTQEDLTRGRTALPSGFTPHLFVMATIESAQQPQSPQRAADQPTNIGTTVAIPNETPLRTNSASLLMNQNEGVLRDVLDELDRERSSRAEMEARVRVLEEDLHAQKRMNANQNGAALSSREFLTLQAERDSYLEILDALTKDRPAFSPTQRLPLHVVRLLEVMPWDPRARQHLFSQVTLYEWQVWGADKQWQTRLRYFPVIFKTLPIVVPQPGKTVGEAPTSSSPPRQCVLTNMNMTQILNIDKGYPLPQDGGDWVWVGGWRIEKGHEVDDEGWSYSNSEDLTLESSYYSELRAPQRGAKNFVRRRRKWARSRVMIDYPHASTMTKEYLKLLSEKAELDVSVEKLTTQLVETKTKLTSAEDKHMTLKEETRRRMSKLEAEVAEKERVIKALQQKKGLDDDALLQLTAKKDQVQELRSAVTAWVNSTVAKRNGSGDTVATEGAESLSDDNDSAVVSAKSSKTDVKQQVLESLKGKGTDFFEKIKQKGEEELEKIKKQNRAGGIAWPAALTKKSEDSEGSPNRI